MFCDPNLVIVHHEFADESSVRAFLQLVQSDEFRAGPVEQGGVIPETVEIWVGEEV